MQLSYLKPLAMKAFTVNGIFILALTPVAVVGQINSPGDARALGLESLRNIVQKEGVPLPLNIQKFVKNINAARQLGKALFHEMAVGSDGIQACATCHFAAGADPRSKNQLNPDLLRVKKQRDGDVKGFFNAITDSDSGFEIGGPNYKLRRKDFPFVKDIGDGANVVINGDTVSSAKGNSNDVAASQGVLFTLFDSVIEGALEDLGTPIPDKIFNVGGITPGEWNRVTPRRPSMQYSTSPTSGMGAPTISSMVRTRSASKTAMPESLCRVAILSWNTRSI